MTDIRAFHCEICNRHRLMHHVYRINAKDRRILAMRAHMDTPRDPVVRNGTRGCRHGCSLRAASVNSNDERSLGSHYPTGVFSIVPHALIDEAY